MSAKKEHLSFLPPPDFCEDIWAYLSRTDRPIVVYGMGNGGDKLVARLNGIGAEVADFLASDDFVRGQTFHGKKVLTLRQVEEKYEDFIILVCFGSHLDSVTQRIYQIAEEHELYIPDMPLAGEDYFDAAFYRENYAQIVKALSLLADDASVRIFAETIWYKLTAGPAHLKNAVWDEDEKKLLGFPHIRTAVDVGAYRGDTLKELLEETDELSAVYALEPDPKNFAKLSSYAETIAEGVRVKCVCAAAWDEDGNADLAVSGNRNSSVVTSGGATSSYQHKKTEVSLRRIDTVLSEDTALSGIDYIKYDTEGAELRALKGSDGVISASLPSLLVSAYHRSEDIFSLPLYLMERYGDRYKLYFRRRCCIPAWDLDLLAIPQK